MANVTTELKVVVRSVGKGEIDKLSEALIDLGSKALKPVDQKLKSSVAELKQLSSQSTQTKNNIKGFSNAFKELANNLEIGSKEFKQATAEAARLDKQLASLEKRKPARGARLRGAAQTAGAIAAGGVFGGPEGALGAAIGGIAGGGPAGAAVGAAIGAQVGQIRQALGATAEYSAGLDKLRIALRGVTTSAVEYQEGLDFIKKTTKEFAIPQEVVTRQFTKLQASVQGAGGNLEDTKTAFNGIVAAVRATGGSLQDVDSALTATAQVFSKGKVSAEELRQQIGERLPGAFTLFAESMGLTPQELDKALEDGKVSLQDFQRFAEAIFERYGENAKTIAEGPEAAGDRLKVALEELYEAVGQLLAPIGATFQDTFTKIAQAITIATNALSNFFGIGDEPRKDKLIGLLNKNKENIEFTKNVIAEAQQELQGKKGLDPGGYIAQRIDDAKRLLAEQNTKQSKYASELNQIIDRITRTDVMVQQPTAGGGFSGIIPDAVKEAGKKAGGKDSEREALRALQERQRLLTQVNNIELKIQEKREKGRLTASDLVVKAQNELALLNEQNPARKIALDFEQQRAAAHEKAVRAIEATNDPLQQQLANQRFFLDLQILSVKEQNALKDVAEETSSVFESIKKTVAEGLTNAIEGLIDGTKSLGESLSGVLRQMASLFLRAGIGGFKNADGEGGSGLLGLFANGGVIAKNQIVPFASGGVVNKPTLFPMANGMGLMGEAGPEAIMPLRRGPGGRLGVEANGGLGNVVVNVDASGSSVQGDQPNAKALGSAIGAAVQAELIKQKRPGGLLS